jgi:acyl-CoA synthetase (AMP-forming)/AMP-acid ligase II
VIQAAYDPDVIARLDGVLTERRPGTKHDLHPELALLLSTSGSTGSPKLVRLSAVNLQANAQAIAEYLAIRQRVLRSSPQRRRITLRPCPRVVCTVLGGDTCTSAGA